MKAEHTLADAARVLEIINGNWTTQVAGVAAELGIADLLLEAPLGADALARAAGCESGAMLRLLKAMTSLGLCVQNDDRTFALTPAGALLRGDGGPSMRSWAIWSALCQWDTWGRMIESVRTGRSARQLATGREGYAHLETDARAAGIFNRAMVELTGFVADAVARAFDFCRFRRLVDVGGGHGELLLAILARHPAASGVVFDLPHAMDGARVRAKSTGLADRSRFEAGNFFDSTPAGDLYLLKSILHNWDDGRAAAILARCRAAIEPDGRLLVIERLMPERVTGAAHERTVIRGDLNMLVGLGGRERTRGEFVGLLHAAGFDCSEPVTIDMGYSILEATARA